MLDPTELPAAAGSRLAIFDGTGSAIYLLADMDWFTVYCLGKALLFAAFWIAVMWAGDSSGRSAKPVQAKFPVRETRGG